MRISEAMRKGCEMRPRKSRIFWLQGENAACALGAAYLGYFGEPTEEEKYGSVGNLNETGRRRLHAAVPVLKSVACGIVRRNEGFGEFKGSPWTREQIADWLEEQGL